MSNEPFVIERIYNAPIDLFIEDYLYENYQELRPYQFILLSQLVTEGKTAVTDKRSMRLTPTKVYTASKVLNIINAMQLKDLYGVDTIKQFEASPTELKQAHTLWDEFLEYRKDRGPGEEYELVKHWGEDLGLQNYFELVDEEDFRNRAKTVEEVMKSIDDDPFGIDVDKNFKEKEMEKFMATHKQLGSNPAVMWFMVDALQFFKDKPKGKIKEIALEIAMVGTQGINPSKENTYKLNSFPGKDFSGYHLLAWYYVSWKLAMPDMLDKLELPYDNEYIQAETIFKTNQ